MLLCRLLRRFFTLFDLPFASALERLRGCGRYPSLGGGMHAQRRGEWRSIVRVEIVGWSWDIKYLMN